MKPILFAFPQNEKLAQSLSQQLQWDLGEMVWRHFPDGESSIRIDSPVATREVIFVCTLHRPDEKFLPLFFAAKIAKELGATRIGLITPYLAYMRQDQRFQPGEGINSRYFAELLSQVFDWLVTVDPHLHRIDSLDQIYSIRTAVVHAAPLLSEWIRKNVKKPLLIGPDRESEQWVSEVAQGAQAPFVVLEKKRLGDRQVQIELPESLKSNSTHTLVLVDDIISTGQTMIQTLEQFEGSKKRASVCVGVHAVFSEEAYQNLFKTGTRVVSCNTVTHPSNEIDLSPLIAERVKKFIREAEV